MTTKLLVFFTFLLVIVPFALATDNSSNNTPTSENITKNLSQISENQISAQELIQTQNSLRTEILDWNYKFINIFLICFSIIMAIHVAIVAYWMSEGRKVDKNNLKEELTKEIRQQIKIAVETKLDDSNKPEDTKTTEEKKNVLREPFKD